MTIDWTRVLPVIVSVIIIITVGIVAQSSKTIAGIVATMPIGIPLALWIVDTQSKGSQDSLVDSTQAFFTGLIPTVFFTIAILIASRLGFRLVPTLAIGYIVWAIVLGIVLLVRRMTGL